MSATASTTGPSNPVDETQPLLGLRTGEAHVHVRADPEAAALPNELEEAEVVVKRAYLSGILWYFLYLVFAAFAGAILVGIIKGFIENGDVEVGAIFNHRPLSRSPLLKFPQFDFKKALWRALGGGLSGAAGMATLYVR
jgi:hypothetical protein